MGLVKIASDLKREVKRLQFRTPVTHVYNPLEYAWTPHRRYLERFGAGPKEAVLLGMNPGPWGMAQTGVPFGEVQLVAKWLKIEGSVQKPDDEHPKRPILGFECARSEVSGARLWGWARDTFKTPKRFFSRFFVANYCPLVFMEESGRNRTPDKLPADERGPLLEICDRSLVRMIDHFSPNHVVGVGAFAETRARETLDENTFRIGRILHPSPASPIANRGWAKAVVKDLAKLGIKL